MSNKNDLNDFIFTAESVSLTFSDEKGDVINSNAMKRSWVTAMGIQTVRGRTFTLVGLKDVSRALWF